MQWHRDYTALGHTANLAGRMEQIAEGDVRIGADQVGFSPSLGLSLFQGFVLSLTGLPRDGGAELDRVIGPARASQQLGLICFGDNYHVLRSEVTGEAASALAHARAAVDYAERTGSQHLRIAGYRNLGLANVLNRGAWRDALEALEQALTIGRERCLPASEGGVLAVMAAAHLALGDGAKALALAEEAIAVCRRSGARFFEFSAQLARIRALREIEGVQATGEIEAALADAGA